MNTTMCVSHVDIMKMCINVRDRLVLFGPLLVLPHRQKLYDAWIRLIQMNVVCVTWWQ